MNLKRDGQLKIAIFVDSFYPNLGGMETSAADLAQALGEQGHMVTVFAPKFSIKDFKQRNLLARNAGAGGSVVEIDLGPNVEVQRLFSLPLLGGMPGRMAIPLLAGYRALKKNRPDIIHTQTIFGAGLEALVASRLLKIPLVGTNHSILSEFAIYSPVLPKVFAWLAGRYETWFYRHCRVLSAPSQAVISAMRENGFKGTTQVVSNIIDVETFKPAEAPDDGLLGAVQRPSSGEFSIRPSSVVFAGRFAPEKRVEILLQAIALVKKEVPEVALALAGAGPEETRWRKIIGQLKIEDNVKFVGRLNKKQLAELFQSSKVFAIASAIESQGMVALEAMACGLPVVGVNGRALPEYIHGDNGFIVAIDDYQAMAKCLVKILKDPALAKKLGQAGRQQVEKFSKQNIIKIWEKIYET